MRNAAKLATAVLAGIALWALASAVLAQTKPAQPKPAPPPAAAAPAASPAAAASAITAPAVAATIAADQASLAQLAAQAGLVSNDARLAAMGAKAIAIEARARTEAAGAQAQIVQLDAQIARLTPRRRGRPTAAETAKQAPLLAQRNVLATQAAQAESLAEAARGTFSDIAERRREGFSDRVLTRSASPVSPDFWTSLAGAAGNDGERLVEMTSEAVDTAVSAPEPRGVIGLAIGLAVGVALVLPARRWLERFARRKTGADVRAGLSKTGAALWVAAVDTAAPTLAMIALRIGAEWGGLVSDDAKSMAGAAVGATAWAAGILALGRVLATEKDRGHRLLPVADDVARRIRLPLLAVALVTAAGFMLTRLNYVVGASVAATIAANCVVSLAYAASAMLVVVSFGRGEASAEDAGAQAPAWTLISVILSAAVVVTVGAVIAGYTTLATLTSGQIFWLSLIAAAAYLVMRFADDLTLALFKPGGWAARSLFVLFRFRRSTIAQVGALISAALQVLIIVAALSLALTPFGQGGDLLLSHLSQLAAPIHIGSAVVSPVAIGAGLATFIIGMGLARGVQGWIVRRYLPVTDWDAGVRNSVTTGVGYLGVAIALACALAATGLGFAQIALVASALSVGIGFGLQNVVQNFVSGVILLIERPVKVGDWINIDGVEGDVRHIRVRATEIALRDRSTMIVPNSDLITKSVQNKTIGEPYSRVELKLSINLAADVTRARDLILQTIGKVEGAADDPAPEVYIDSLAAAGAVNLTCHFYVGNPRQAYVRRSEGYFAILGALQAAEIGFAGVA